MIDRAPAIAAWYRALRPGVGLVTVNPGRPLSQGHANEVVVADVTVEVDGERTTESVVVRLPGSGPPVFPEHDLVAESAVQELAHRGGVPVPHPVIVELDDAWLGAPFLVMPLVAGRHPGEVPPLTDWLSAASPDDQRRVQVGMLEALTSLHRTTWVGTPVDGLLRQPASPGGEVSWWAEYAVWACEGRSSGPLLELFDRCRDGAPPAGPPSSVLWGDVRLGNTVVGDDLRPAALVDWEMATIGPAESDVAWYTALSGMTDHFVGRSLPGFLDRDGVVAHVEAGLGRPLRDVEWHEAFALARAAAIHLRTRVVAALVDGSPPPDPAGDGVVQYALRLVR